jgi:hypothetical protein
MRVGMIFECGRNGADGKVYRCLAEKIRGDLDIISEFLDKKPKLVEKCGEVAKFLMEEMNCEKVVIIWDFRPFWLDNREDKTKPCPMQDCQRIQTALASAQLTSQQRDKIHLICIVQELETFLLVDESAICAYLEGIKKRPCKVQSMKNPERISNPKERLHDIFQQNGYRKYDDLKDAEKIAQLISIDKLKRSKAFIRFGKTVRML